MFHIPSFFRFPACGLDGCASFDVAVAMCLSMSVMSITPDTLTSLVFIGVAFLAFLFLGFFTVTLSSVVSIGDALLAFLLICFFGVNLSSLSPAF